MLIEGNDQYLRATRIGSSPFAGGANNKDDPWVYRPGIYVKNMQRDGMFVHISSNTRGKF